MGEREAGREIEVTTTRDRIRGVPRAWEAQYRRPAGWRHTRYGDSEETWRKLCALDLDSATVEDVAEIIGNESWTRLTCDQCLRDVDRVVCMGQEPDYESSTAYLCQPCIESALAALKATP